MSLERKRIRAALRPRAGRGQVLVALLCGLLGFGVAVQVRSSAADGGRAGARSEDLVRILGDLSTRAERLRTEIDALRATRDRLAAGTDRSAVALAEARRRARALGILAGTLPHRGPGVTVTITDPKSSVRAAVVLDTIEELRDAGAEAIQVGGSSGRPVRVVASTYLLDTAAGGLDVDGTALRPPYRLVAVGDPATLDAAMRIPGGVLDAVASNAGARAAVAASPRVAVTALRPLRAPRYARPAPPPTASPGG
jgi:uncharacterized protein YlxW (UPF0749 family)